VLYFCINAFVVKWYGECEFWLALGKVFLLGMLFSFTFITMVGGNPKHDAYGFRYWKNPGAFAEHITTGPLGRFEGFLGALWSAAFTVVGPEYVSMVAGEVKSPRKYLKQAFKATYARFGLFFIGSALCVGIVIPYNNTTLLEIFNGEAGGAGTAAASPYVIAMNSTSHILL
jgi:amino acid transporter